MATTRRTTKRHMVLTATTILTVAAMAMSCGSADDETATSTSTPTSAQINDTTQPPADDGTDDGHSTDDPSTTDGSAGSSSTSPTDTTSSGETAIEVFFNNDDPDECAAVDGYPRTSPAGVNAARHAFDQLVSGPTAGDAGAVSFFSSETEGMVRSVTITDGTMVVDFADFRSILGPAGATTSCGSAALLGQLNATAFQFEEVDEVRYETDGSCAAFGEWLQRDCIDIARPNWEEEVAGQLPGEPFDGILPPGRRSAWSEWKPTTF